METKEIDISNFKFINNQYNEIVFVEGGQGLNDAEEYLYQHLVGRGYYPIVLENVYDNPRQLISLMYLQPRTIVLGTTGVYRDEIDQCIEYFKIAEFIPDCVLFSFGEDKLRHLIREMLVKKPTMQIYNYVAWDSQDIQIEEITDDFK